MYKIDMNKKPTVLVSWPLKQSTLEHFDQSIEYICIENVESQYEECLHLIEHVDGLMAFDLTIDKQLLDKAKQLKVIGNYAVGFDNIDIQYAKEKGIAVSNTPHAVTMPTAELAFALLLALTRKIKYLDVGLREHSFSSWSEPATIGVSLQGKTIGIVGYGRIGAKVGEMAKLFGMNVIYYKRHQLPEAEEKNQGVSYKDIDILFKEADVVSLHMPLNQDTKYIINDQLLSRMKPTAFLINTARGDVVNPEALYNSLLNKKIAGAGLDVFWDEPNIPQHFLELENVILTPHAGTNTKEGRKQMLIELHDNISSFFRTGEVISRVV